MGPIFKVVKIARPNQQANIKVSQNIPLNDNTKLLQNAQSNIVVIPVPILPMPEIQLESQSRIIGSA